MTQFDASEAIQPPKKARLAFNSLTPLKVNLATLKGIITCSNQDNSKGKGKTLANPA
jgi:hypothetical protein